MPTSELPERQPTDADLFESVERAIHALETHGDVTVRETVRVLLEGIDTVHRTGLSHLVQAVHGMAGDAFLNRLLSDPAVRMLLMSYNLVTVDRRLQAEEALDTVRGHLHDHGIDVEIVEVVGGVVYVRLHQSHRAGTISKDLPLDAVRRDLEAALGSEFVGFQELVVRDRDPVAVPVVVPLAAVRRANRPVYEDVLAVDELPVGTLRAVRVRDASVLLANVSGELYAIRNQCGDSPLPLEFSTLHGSELRCSWHGCRYDIRSGRRLDAANGGVQAFPVSVADGRIRIAAAVDSGGAS